MKALALGCGEMGSVAIEDMVKSGVFEEVVCGDIDEKKAEKLTKKLESKGTEVSSQFVDVTESDELANLMKDFDIAVSCVGPFYRFGEPTARAAIEAGIDYVDICDDYDATEKILNLDSKAKEAGVTVITGLGVSPGITNVLAKIGSIWLDEVKEIHTCSLWSASDPGGLAIQRHYGGRAGVEKAPTYQDGEFVEVQPLIDGEEELEFPEPVRKQVVYHIGHPEPITLPKYIDGVEYVDNKGMVFPTSIRDSILKLGEISLLSHDPVNMGDFSVSPVDFASAFLFEKALEMETSVKPALRVEVVGREDGKTTRYIFSGIGGTGEATGIPASVGAQMIAEGEMNANGVFPPEACVDPEDEDRIDPDKLLSLFVEEKDIGEEFETKRIVEEEI